MREESNALHRLWPRDLHQTLEKAIGEPRDDAWQTVWHDGVEWVCPETGNEHRPSNNTGGGGD